MPWKTTTVRLDTFSSAPVDFAAYAVDPAEVIVAGATRAARAIDTSHLRPAVRWRFTPPPGYRFQTSDVPVPLGSAEGFYVIEARRGDASQQVWIDRTRLGLLTKEGPEGLTLWTVDLRSGRAARDVKVELLVNGALANRSTDRNGVLVWRDRGRPTFALAEYGGSRAFASLLPQAPLPQAIVGVRVDAAVVRAGRTVRVVGFARRRQAGGLRRVGGDARVTLGKPGTTLAAQSVHLDEAGAFAADLAVPESAPAGDYAVLANAGGTVGGTTVHVDAASDVALSIASTCPCAAANAVPFAVIAARGAEPAAGIAVRVQIVRVPHIVPPGERDDAPRWGNTTVSDATVRTGSDGRAAIAIPPPTDGLSSTYGVRASTAGDAATATAQIVVPTAAVALAVEPDALAATQREPVGFEVRGFAVTGGEPAAGIPVTVRLSHGATSSEQSALLDADGRAHVVFNDAHLGTNLAVATAAGADARSALDAASVTVSPVGPAGAGASVGVVTVKLDRVRYKPGDRIGISVTAPGASGDALVTLEGARTYATRIAPLADGRAGASLDLADVQGDARIGVAVVRDGAVETASVPLSIDAPGHPRAFTLVADRATYAPGAVAHVALKDGEAAGTAVVRVSDARPSGSAELDDIAAALAGGGTTSENPSSENPGWHVYVQTSKAKGGDVYGAERPREVRLDAPTLGAAAPRTLSWVVARDTAGALDVTLPQTPGTYVLSVAQIYDDGDVGGASTSIVVK